MFVLLISIGSDDLLLNWLLLLLLMSLSSLISYCQSGTAVLRIAIVGKWVVPICCLFAVDAFVLVTLD